MKKKGNKWANKLKVNGKSQLRGEKKDKRKKG